MAEYIIENECLKVTIASRGCEIISVVNKSNGREYIWNGSPEAWKRHAPVLFPLVGRYRDDESIYNGRSYHMTQHGFARDMEFSLVSKTDSEIKMSLTQTKETKIKYPFNFCLTLGYRLSGNNLIASYDVLNTSDTDMYFSIGGHPAFAAPLDSKDTEGRVTAAGCEMLFEAKNKKQFLEYGLLNSEGLFIGESHKLQLEGGRVSITPEFFDADAYIVENSQFNSVSLLYRGKKFVTVEFDAPVFGIWSPAHKNVPFVCIEPWYGRCDRADFNKQLKDREWGNELSPQESFFREYKMIFS
ncbi:MAG: aldose 1-epimerase family protein [Eubacteriales bacterium]|nr:aldose 1-epimerase family protein [Eubacteriales bacterium]